MVFINYNTSNVSMLLVSRFNFLFNFISTEYLDLKVIVCKFSYLQSILDNYFIKPNFEQINQSLL